MAGGLPACFFVVVGLSVGFEFHQQFENKKKKGRKLCIFFFTTITLSCPGCGLLGTNCSTVHLPLPLDTALLAAV